MKRFIFPIGLWLLFEIIAATLWWVSNNVFYLFNFSYIGASLAIGVFFYLRKIQYARNIVQFSVGLYMLVYLGILSGENMQMEGFWYYLFLGAFDAAVTHYFVAKIVGPLLFGRGWCGYACWTAMILDLLPYKVPQKRRDVTSVRYIVFWGSFLFVSMLFVFAVPDKERILFWGFLIGNAAYYAVGIGLAFAFKDNRAFCKMVCPVAVFLKPASYYALLRVKNDETKCVSCGKCEKNCPMHVAVWDNSRRRLHGTDCILCLQCIEGCPKKSLSL